MLSIVVTTLITTYVAAFIVEGVSLYVYFRRQERAADENQTTEAA